MNEHELITIDYKLEVSEPTLFYPCAGSELQLPIECFSDIVKNFYFVDTRRIRFPQLTDRYSIIGGNKRCVGNPENFRDEKTDNTFRVHRWQERGEDAIKKIPSIGIFFYRGDNPVDGEGSSGVLWFGKELFDQILARLASGGLIVTDGSNPGPNGPKQFSEFYHNREIGPSVKDKATPFEYEGREFECIGYVGDRYGPTLVWQVLNM